MTKIPVITQNFSSPDVFTDTPLMLLPRSSSQTSIDRDQEGFSQLLLHDLNRHRQTYLRSYSAFEVLKKRQDFVLRQENLRSLQNFEQRVTTKQDQFIDQSIHSYEQCFVKVIDGNTTPNGTHPEPTKRVKSSSATLGKFHLHQLSNIPATPLDPPPIIPFHRYQRTHRPPLRPKYRSQSSLQRSAQSLHDAFQSSSFTTSSQPFVSFTESYLLKFGDRSSSNLQFTTNTRHGMNGIQENDEEEGDDDDDDNVQMQHGLSVKVETTYSTNQNRKQDQKSKTSELQSIRAHLSTHNTNTPSSTPQVGYNDALRDGLTTAKSNESVGNKTPLNNEKRRSSQQSTGQQSNGDSKASTKKSKTGKNKSNTGDLQTDRKSESQQTHMNAHDIDDDNTNTNNHHNNTNGNTDLFKSAISVQNYERNPLHQNLASKIERLLPGVPRKAPSVQPRTTTKSTENNTSTKPTVDLVHTQMAQTSTVTTPKLSEELTTAINTNEEQTVTSLTNNQLETQQETNEQLLQQQPSIDFPDIRKRVKKGAFDGTDSLNNFVAFDLGLMGQQRPPVKRTRFRFRKDNKNQNEDGTDIYPEDQETLDLLEKIQQSATGLTIGQSPVSQTGCRFELPPDLKLLETLTPLEYLTKYCRLSPRRNHQFKRIFDKYRNNQYRLELNYLYQTIIDIHSESFTPLQYIDLCQLIDLGTEQHQFTYETFAGILALCERILYDSTQFRSGLDEHDLAKDTIERCDFDSLDRKFDGLIINDKMKKLLKTL